jgi:hypothetical protein
VQASTILYGGLLHYEHEHEHELTWTKVIVIRMLLDTCFAKRVPTGRKRTRVPEYLVAQKAFEIRLEVGQRIAHSGRSADRIRDHGGGEPRRLCGTVVTVMATGRVVWAFPWTTHDGYCVSW